MNEKISWGIDLGGTKIEGVVLRTQAGGAYEVLCRLRVPTEASDGYAHVLGQIAKLVAMMKQETALTPTRIGMGTPGALDPLLQTLRNSNTTCLNGQPVKKDIETLLQLPVEIANDANCFALAEFKLGAVAQQAPQATSAFGVIMGTGVGGGVVMNGQLWNGLQGIAGEWGHNHLDDSGGPCYCGKTGCVETVIAGPALERFYHSLTGRQLPLRSIVENAGTDPAAAATMDRLTDQFAKAISVVLNILDPEVVVLGGGVSNIPLLYTEGVERVKKYLFNSRMDTRFLRPALGDSAGVFGAAML